MFEASGYLTQQLRRQISEGGRHNSGAIAEVLNLKEARMPVRDAKAVRLGDVLCHKARNFLAGRCRHMSHDEAK